MEGPQFPQSQTQFVQGRSEHAGRQVKLRQEDFYLLLEEFKIEFILASRGLGRRLDNDELKLI
jgi:hypothetical protein